MIRILTNYARLFLGVLGGLAVLPIVGWAIGPDAVGLVLLLGASVGLAGLVNELIQNTLVREVGALYHRAERERAAGAHPADRPDVFTEGFSAAVAIATGATLVSLALFGVLFASLSKLNIVPELRAAAGVLVIVKAIGSAAGLLLAPYFNMLLIRERMITYNACLVFGRLAEFSAAVIVFIVAGVRDPETGLVAFGILGTGLTIANAAVAAGIVLSGDRRCLPRPRLVRWAVARPMLIHGGLNSLAVLAMNLHLRLGALLTNLFFGLTGNLYFGAGQVLTGYARRLSTGMTDGLDAVAARVQSQHHGDRDHEQQHLGRLLRRSTHQHALIALPAGLGIALLAEPIVSLWLGLRTPDLPDGWKSAAAGVIVALSIGVTARGISDGWVRILYGAGHVRVYAPLALLGGLANPLLTVAAVYLFTPGGPDGSLAHPPPAGFFAAPVVFSAIMLIVHLGLLSRATVRTLNAKPRDVWQPMARPMLAALLPSPALIGPVLIIERWTPLHLAAVVLAYGLLWVGCVAAVGLPPEMRAAVVDRLRRGRRGLPTPPAGAADSSADPAGEAFSLPESSTATGIGEDEDLDPTTAEPDPPDPFEPPGPHGSPEPHGPDGRHGGDGAITPPLHTGSGQAPDRPRSASDTARADPAPSSQPVS